MKIILRCRALKRLLYRKYVREGSSRYVLLVPRLGIVVKFARTRIGRTFWRLIREKMSSNPSTRAFAFKMFSTFWRMSAVKGLIENVSERRLYRKTKCPLLVPTYVSLGFVNIQRLQLGRRPSGYKWFAQLTFLMQYHNWVSSHSFGNHDNFLIDDAGKLRMLDYGSPVIGPAIERFGTTLYDRFDYSRELTVLELEQSRELGILWDHSRRKEREARAVRNAVK
jgi:hypothetical protein